MEPAIFLDRDGVIIENRENYVRSWEDMVFLPGVTTALSGLAAYRYKIIIVTNQSAIGRGILTAEAVDGMNQKMADAVRLAGGRVDGVFVCPHKPDEYCSCRKPQPGLILQAAEALNIDLGGSYMVGDALSDVEAGIAAGVRVSLMVRTGRGEVQMKLPQAVKINPLIVYPSLVEVVAAIQSGSL